MYIQRDVYGNVQMNKMAASFTKKALGECFNNMWVRFKANCSKLIESARSSLCSMRCVALKTVARVSLAIITLGVSECVYSCITCYKAKCRRNTDPNVRSHVMP